MKKLMVVMVAMVMVMAMSSVALPELTKPKLKPSRHGTRSVSLQSAMQAKQ